MIFKLAAAGGSSIPSTELSLGWSLFKGPISPIKEIVSTSSIEGRLLDTGIQEFERETLVLLIRERLIKLDNYLSQQVISSTISQEAAELFRNGAEEIIMQFGASIGVPDACPGPGGQMIYYWEKKNGSIQLDIKSNGESELYLLDRKNNRDYLLEYTLGKLAESNPDVCANLVRTIQTIIKK